MTGEVEGKRVVVTGSSRRLGRAFARALAKEGTHLIINGSNENALRETAERISAAGRESASDRAKHLNGQCLTCNGRKTSLWTHRYDFAVSTRDSVWTLDA